MSIIIGIVLGGLVGYGLGQEGVSLAILGQTWQLSSSSFKPIGQLFLNMMFVTIVPLVFFSITASITKTAQSGRLKKILINALLVFVSTATVMACIAYVGFLWYEPVRDINLSQLLNDTTLEEGIKSVAFGDMLVNTFTANDFLDLFRRQNLLALIIFSFFLGGAILMAGEAGKPIAKAIEAGQAVVLKLVKIIMYAAPIGLGCYFADIVGELGPKIVGAYAHVLLLYILLTLLSFLGLNTLYAWLAGGSQGVRIFWKNALTPSLTAIATTSSAACIPVNLIAAKNMHIPDDIAQTIVPLGANTHKDGSVMGGVFKIMFLLALVGMSAKTAPMFIAIILASLLVGIVIGAIPSGGLTAEVLICTLFGVPVDYVGIILVISIIIDIPATLLNSTGNNVCLMLITRLIEGKDWLQKALS
jgi:Na+/H+-dicarboxylate symporter